MSRIPAGVDGFRVGGRHAVAELLAAQVLHLTEPVVFLVAEYRDGWVLGDGWVTRFEDVGEARAYARTVREPYRVGVLAVVPVDGGRLYPGGEIR